MSVDPQRWSSWEVPVHVIVECYGGWGRGRWGGDLHEVSCSTSICADSYWGNWTVYNLGDSVSRNLPLHTVFSLILRVPLNHTSLPSYARQPPSDPAWIWLEWPTSPCLPQQASYLPQGHLEPIPPHVWGNHHRWCSSWEYWERWAKSKRWLSNRTPPMVVKCRRTSPNTKVEW